MKKKIILNIETEDQDHCSKNCPAFQSIEIGKNSYMYLCHYFGGALRRTKYDKPVRNAMCCNLSALRKSPISECTGSSVKFSP